MRAESSLVKAVALVALAATFSIGQAAANADGADSYPSNALPLTSGQTVTGGVPITDHHRYCDLGYQCAGHPGVQYYRVPLEAGDQATFDFQAFVANSYVEVCILNPSVTDYTVADAFCLPGGYARTDDGTSRAQLKWTAGAAGSYLVAVSHPALDIDAPWGYSMNTYVRHRVTPILHVKGPKNARTGQTIKLRGSITPATSQRVVLTSKSPAHGWQKMGTTKSDSAGRFSFPYHLGHKGPHKFRVTFKGKGLYNAASSNTWKMSVG